jgi:hypothetical protein
MHRVLEVIKPNSRATDQKLRQKSSGLEACRFHRLTKSPFLQFLLLLRLQTISKHKSTKSILSTLKIKSFTRPKPTWRRAKIKKLQLNAFTCSVFYIENRWSKEQFRIPSMKFLPFRLNLKRSKLLLC